MSTSSLPSHTDPHLWFDPHPKPNQIPPESLLLLETYANIPRANVIDHLIRVRDAAWHVYPYPCLGQWRFLDRAITHLPEYAEVLSGVRSGATFLDIACCVGQTIRLLVADGAPAENLYGCDVQPGFIELGYELFQDRDRLAATFLVADVFDAESGLGGLKGGIDVVYAGSFFHLFGREKQMEAGRAVARLLRARPGSMIVGRQAGAVTPVEASGPVGRMFRHNVESFQAMWEEIGEELGVGFTVTGTLKEFPGEHYFKEDDIRYLWFCVRRQ